MALCRSMHPHTFGLRPLSTSSAVMDSKSRDSETKHQAEDDNSSSNTSSVSQQALAWDDKTVVPPIHANRTLVLCFDGTGAYDFPQ